MNVFITSFPESVGDVTRSSEHQGGGQGSNHRDQTTIDVEYHLGMERNPIALPVVDEESVLETPQKTQSLSLVEVGFSSPRS